MQRRPEAAAWQRLYGLARWRRLRLAQLRAEPLCRTCLDDGRVTAATVCDHIEPHRGDETKFWAGPFQSLCKPHHDAYKQQVERRGYSSIIGADGWPTDAQHPANRAGGG